MASLLHRHVFHLVLLAALAAFSSSALPQDYPSRPIKLVVGWPPGASGDLLARVLATEMSASLKQPVVVENRTGAGANLASGAVARASADGYTLLVGGDYSHAINPHLYKKLGFDTEKDFVAISRIVNYPVIVAVNPTVPANSLRDLVVLAKASPGKFDYATSLGTSTHLAGFLFTQVAHVDMTHIPFAGGGPAMLATVAGTTPIVLATGPAVLAQAKAGKLRILSVASAAPSAVVPGVPGTAEAGLGAVDISGWYGVWAPAGTPLPIIDKLFAEVTKVFRNEDVRRKLEPQGLASAPSQSAAEFDAFVRSQATFFGKLARDSGMKLD